MGRSTVKNASLTISVASCQLARYVILKHWGPDGTPAVSQPDECVILTKVK